MRRIRACRAIAGWISLTLLLAACSGEDAATSISAVLPSPPPPPPSPEFLTPVQVHEEIVRWFTAAGYHEFQVQALADHAKLESGFRPCVAGAGDLRYTFQWGGTRLQRLHRFAGAARCPLLDTQLAFADGELRNDPKFWCFWGAATRSTALAALRRGFGGGSC